RGDPAIVDFDHEIGEAVAQRGRVSIPAALRGLDRDDLISQTGDLGPQFQDFLIRGHEGRGIEAKDRSRKISMGVTGGRNPAMSWWNASRQTASLLSNILYSKGS